MFLLFHVNRCMDCPNLVKVFIVYFCESYYRLLVKVTIVYYYRVNKLYLLTKISRKPSVTTKYFIQHVHR